MRDIKKVVVLGANGTMGAGSAEVFAAGGCEVTLLARTAEKAQAGLESAKGMAKSSTIGELMKVGSYDADLEKAVAEADLIFEALAEDLAIKKEFFSRVTKVRQPDSIVATVSSGLSITEMAAVGDDSFAKHFLGIHLFNPPNVIVGTEVIPHAGTDPALIAPIIEMMETRFGRVITECRDQPAFAGNRVGFKVLNEVAQLAEEHGIAYMDYIIGPHTGRAMRPLATVDLVGLDVHKAIVDNVYDHTNDEAHANFAIPRYVDKLITDGHLGNKTGAKGGFYRRAKEDGKNVSYVLDPATGEYKSPADSKVAPVPYIERMSKLHRVGRYTEAMKVFVEAEGKDADIARKVIFGYVSYGLNRVGDAEVVREARDVDLIMGFGFNWAPPTVLADVIGIKETIAQIDKCGLQVPAVLANAPADKPLFREADVNIGRFFAA